VKTRGVLEVLDDDDGPISEGHLFEAGETVNRGAYIPNRREIPRHLLLRRRRDPKNLLDRYVDAIGDESDLSDEYFTPPVNTAICRMRRQPVWTGVGTKAHSSVRLSGYGRRHE
jgi:hypothetical protein